MPGHNWQLSGTPGYPDEWTSPTPGYSELHIDGRIRGYVEHATGLAFWNYQFATKQERPWASFAAIAPRGTHTSVEQAKTALAEHVAAKDAVCDGNRGIQGEHSGCHPSRCKTGS